MVILIIGIISTVFVVRVMRTETMNRAVALTGIRDYIRYAADYAMARGVTTAVSFNVPGNSFTLYEDNGSGRTLMKNPETGEDFIITLGTGEYKGITLTGFNANGTDEIQFLPYGVPVDAAGMRLAGNAHVELDSILEITILPVTGYCKVAE